MEKQATVETTAAVYFTGIIKCGGMLVFAGRYGIFGAKVDWISQHSVIPELFRQQFYDTGNFFPDFTLQAGGGRIFIILLTMVCTVRQSFCHICFRL